MPHSVRSETHRSPLGSAECTQFRESEWYQQICSGESTLADAIMDRISYDSYKINIESIDPSKDLSMREVYGLDPAQAE